MNLRTILAALRRITTVDGVSVLAVPEDWRAEDSGHNLDDFPTGSALEWLLGSLIPSASVGTWASESQLLRQVRTRLVDTGCTLASAVAVIPVCFDEAEQWVRDEDVPEARIYDTIEWIAQNVEGVGEKDYRVEIAGWVSVTARDEDTARDNVYDILGPGLRSTFVDWSILDIERED